MVGRSRKNAAKATPAKKAAKRSATPAPADARAARTSRTRRNPTDVATDDAIIIAAAIRDEPPAQLDPVAVKQRNADHPHEQPAPLDPAVVKQREADGVFGEKAAPIYVPPEPTE